MRPPIHRRGVGWPAVIERVNVVKDALPRLGTGLVLERKTSWFQYFRSVHYASSCFATHTTGRVTYANECGQPDAIVTEAGTMDDELRAVDQALKDRICGQLNQSPWNETQRDAIKDLVKQIEQLQCELGGFPTTVELAEKMQLTHDDFMSYLKELNLLFQLSNEGESISVHILESLSRIMNNRYAKTRSKVIEELADAICALPKNERLLLGLYYYEELSINEISAVTGFPDAEVSRLVIKGITKLIATAPFR